MNYLPPSLIIVLGLLSSASLTLAFNPSVNDTDEPYEVYVASSDLVTQAEYLGELVGEPHMYEFSIGADTALKLQLFQLDNKEPIPFSLIAVKQNDRNAGVVEVSRLKSKDINWETSRDGILGLKLQQSQSLNADIGPGLYRVEVSTPQNFGKYMLVIGDKAADSGYFKTVGHIRTIQKFFDKSIFSMLFSSYVYYPIGIALVSYLFYYTWRNRIKITEKNA